jgi:hypothetical protein
MRKTPLAMALLVLAATAACATRTVAGAAAPAPSPSSHGWDNLVPDGYAGRFRVAATVLANHDHGPQLCLAVADSLPPQCGGPDIPNWTWNGLKHESGAGTTWGAYLLTGTFDGRTFTLTEPAKGSDGSVTAQLSSPDFSTPCPEPAGGWRPVNPATATDDAFQAASNMVRADPDFAGLWIDSRPPPQDATPMDDPTKLVLNVRFTKDLPRHETEIRRVWGGALCLSPATHTLAELTAIQDQLQGDDVTYTAVDEVTGTVELHMYVATQARQRELDRQYGTGLVHLIGEFEPID